MLELKRALTQKADGTEVYIEVENATGIYNVATNPGGFGAPNPSRNQVALLFYGLHKKTAGDIEAVVNSYNPETVSSFTLPMNKAINGHMELYVFAPLIFNPLGSYTDGDIVYDKENPLDKHLKKRVSGVWVRIEVADLVGEDAEVTTLFKNEFFVPQAKEFVDELNAAQQKKLRAFIYKECGKDDYEELRDRFDFAEGELVAATDDFSAAAYNEAQLKIEELFAYQDILADAA